MKQVLVRTRLSESDGYNSQLGTLEIADWATTSMLLMMHQSHLHQPWRLDRSIHSLTPLPLAPTTSSLSIYKLHQHIIVCPREEHAHWGHARVVFSAIL